MQRAGFGDLQNCLRRHILELVDQFGFSRRKGTHRKSITCLEKRTSSVRDASDKGTGNLGGASDSEEGEMVELRFRIRNSVFTPQSPMRRATIRPLALLCPSVEEAALLGE